MKVLIHRKAEMFTHDHTVDHSGTSLVVPWLRLCTSTAGDTGSIPRQGTKIPLVLGAVQKDKKKKKIGHSDESISNFHKL